MPKYTQYPGESNKAFAQRQMVEQNKSPKFKEAQSWIRDFGLEDFILGQVRQNLEPSTYLTKSQIGEWQQILKERGFYKTSVDSVFGPATRQATLDNFNPEKALESQQFLKAKRDSIENIIQDKWIEEEAKKIMQADEERFLQHRQEVIRKQLGKHFSKKKKEPSMRQATNQEIINPKMPSETMRNYEEKQKRAKENEEMMRLRRMSGMDSY